MTKSLIKHKAIIVIYKVIMAIELLIILAHIGVLAIMFYQEYGYWWAWWF